VKAKFHFFFFNIFATLAKNIFKKFVANLTVIAQAKEFHDFG